MDFAGTFSDHILPGKVHDLNVSFLADRYSQHFGGTAGNIAYTLALFGIAPVVIGSIGNDGERYLAWLRSHKVDTTYVHTVGSLATASAHLITDQQGNQIAGFFPGAAGRRTPAPNARELTTADFACISPTGPIDMIAYPKLYTRLRIPYAYDPGQQITTLSKAALLAGWKGAKIFFSNDYELALFTRKTGLSERVLETMGKIVVTTYGAKGSLIRIEGKRIRIPSATPKRVIDPTGAGDAFRAGFLAGYVRGLPVSTCGKMGAVASVYTVEQYGTQTHTFTQRAFQTRYRRNFSQRIDW